MFKCGCPVGIQRDCGQPVTEFFLTAGQVIARCADHAQLFILLGDPRLTEAEAVVAEVHYERGPG